MKKRLLTAIVIIIAAGGVKAQDIKSKDVPAVVKAALIKKYPEATKVGWEKEKGNFEANWGGKSGEDNSVQFAPSGDLIEIVKSISLSQLPKSIDLYVKENYQGARITEAGRVTDSK